MRVKGEESEGALRAVVSSHLSMATIASKVRASPQVPQTLSLLPTADYLHEKSRCVCVCVCVCVRVRVCVCTCARVC